MLPATERQLKNILDYLRKDLGNCIYMYIDIGKYSLDNPNMKVWYSEDEIGINLVVMKYYDSIQLYSDRDVLDINDALKIVIQEKVSMVSGKLEIIAKLYQRCNNIYNISFSCVYNLCSYRKYDDMGMVQPAGTSDILEIAELICSDKGIGGHYTVEVLAEQLAERINTGMGRNFVIRKNGKIIAHIATYAEYEGIAVTSGLIVHPDYREFLYGVIIESYLVNKLLSEGKRVFAFIIDKRREKLLSALGNKKYGDCGKLTFISKI